MAVSNFGVSTVLLLSMGYLGSRIRDQFVGEEPFFMWTYLIVGTWLYQAVSYALLGASPNPVSYLLVRSPLDALATGAVGYLTLRSMHWRPAPSGI